MWRKVFLVSLLVGGLIGGAALLPVENDADRQFDGFGDVMVFSEPNAAEVSAYLIYPYGEGANPYVEGLMHYVEHLVAGAVWDTGGFEAMRHSNAWTNRFSTGYWGNGKSEDLPEILQALVTSAAPLKTDTEFAKSERKIVLREYDFRNSGRRSAEVNRDIDNTLYDNNAWSRSVIGEPKEIAEFSLEDAVTLHQRSHRLDKAVLLLAGGISKREVFGVLDAISLPQTMPDIAPLELVDWSVDAAPFRQHAAKSLGGETSPDVVYRKVVQTTECGTDYACDVRLGLLKRILDSGMAGGIAGPLRFDAFFARSFGFDLHHLSDGQVEISFHAVADKDVSRKDLLAEFERVLEKALTQGVPQDTFDRAKGRGLFGEDDKLFSAKQKFKAALSWTQSGLPVPGLLAENRVYDAITLEALNNLARELAAPGRVVVRNLY